VAILSLMEMNNKQENSVNRVWAAAVMEHYIGYEVKYLPYARYPV
jgi:hypothetical protein